MNRKHNTLTKVLSLVLALVLVVGASVAGTLAWLTAKTEKVTNTFASAELFDDPNANFTLWEHKAADVDGDGKYEWAKLENEKLVKVENAENADEVNGNAYIVLPGVNIPKDPTVDVENLEGNAYLYIKVTSSALPTGMSYEIGTDWNALGDAYPGIYVYTGTQANTANVIEATESAKKTFKVNILKDNQVVVAGTYAGTADNISLEFQAYMVQATGNGADAAAAWANTYG